MPFLLADSFQVNLDQRSGAEQKVAKLAAFELQINPANPDLQCQRLANIKDNNLWSARARDNLLTTSGETCSEFVGDLLG